MNINQEKDYLYSMISEMTKERSKLTDAILSLLNRIDNLNEVERLSHNKEREVIFVEEPIEFQEPNLPVEESLSDIIARHNRENKKHEEVKVEEEIKVEESIIPRLEIDRAKDRLPKRKPLSSERATSLIVEILKEAGKPLGANVIHAKLCEMTSRNITKSNFNSNVLPRAVRGSKNIERATFGYYQYIIKTS